MEFEENVEKKSQWPFDSMTVDGKKEFLKKLCLAMKREMLLLVLVLYALLALGSILKRYSGDWKVAEFYLLRSDSKPSSW